MEWRKQKTFFKFLGLFGIIIMVPFIALGFIIDAYYLKYIEGDIIKQNMAVLEKAVSMFESEVAHLYSAAGEFDESSDFGTRGLQDSAPLYEPASSGIRSVLRTNSVIEDIIFYNYGIPDLVLTTKGTFNSHYYGPYIESRFANREGLVSAFFNEEYYLYGESIPYSSESPFRTIDYIVALPKTNGVMAFRITMRTIDAIFSLPLDGGQLDTFIFDETGSLFYATDGRALDETGQALAAGPADGVQEDGDKIYFKQVSAGSGFTYIGVLPRDVISRGVGYFKNIFLVASILILVVGGMLIFLFTRLNYRPIQKLYQSALDKISPDDIPGEMDIMDKLQHAINTLDDTAKMREAVQLQVLRERVLLRLFQGEYHTAEAFNRDGMLPGLYLPEPAAYRVVSMRYTAQAEPEEVDALFENLEEILSLQCQVYGLNNTEQGQCVLLACYPLDNLPLFSHVLELLASTASSGKLCDIQLGVGNECLEVGGVRSSFLQSKTALDQAYANAGPLVWFQDIGNNGELAYNSLRSELDNLHGAIISHNQVQVAFILDTLVNLISEYHHSLFLAICLCGDIFSTAMKAMNQLDEDYGRQYYSFAKNIDISHFSSVPELMDLVRGTKDTLLHLLEDYNRQSGSLEMSAVMTFIQENCTRYEMSVSMVAAQFALTPSNLSHQFKAQVGYNISDYINKAKMNHAKKLLAMTDLTIHEISEQVGYSQPSSFIRKFKQYESMTPGEYKRRVQEVPS